MTQLEGPEKMQSRMPPSSKAAPAPEVPMTATPAAVPTPSAAHVMHVPPPMRVEVVLEGETVSSAAPVGVIRAPPPYHGFSCFFMMGATMMLFMLLLRQCCLLCAGPKAAPQVAIVAPPEQLQIKLIEPLMASDIKVVAK